MADAGVARVEETFATTSSGRSLHIATNSVLIKNVKPGIAVLCGGSYGTLNDLYFLMPKQLLCIFINPNIYNLINI